MTDAQYQIVRDWCGAQAGWWPARHQAEELLARLAAVFPTTPPSHDQAVREGMGRPGDGNG